MVESAPSGAKCEHYMGSCCGMPPYAGVCTSQTDKVAGEGVYLAIVPVTQDVPVASSPAIWGS